LQANAWKIRARPLGGRQFLFAYVVSLRGVEGGPKLGAFHYEFAHARRESPRRRLYRAAKIKVGVGILAHDCILIDISESGVQLHIPGFDVPDEFVLLLSGDGARKHIQGHLAARP
jgi:hypothetical protein